MQRQYFKILSVFLLSFGFSSLLRAQATYSIATAAWTSTTAWSTVSCGGASCTCTPGDPVTICSGTTITFTGAFTVGPGGDVGTLTINSGGRLIVNGDVTFKKNSVVTINSGGTLTVNGNFSNNNNSNQIVDNGSMTVSLTGSFGNGSTITGSGSVAVTGASSGAGTVFGTSPGCTSCTFSTTLPISLLSFTASYNTDAVNLSWSTAIEINNNYFTIERTLDGVNYITIATLKGAGTSSIEHNYSAYDINPAGGVNYYRLSQTDYDGTTTFQGTVVAAMGIAPAPLKIVPNPADKKCVVVFNENTNESLVLSVYDFTGRAIINKSVEVVKGANTIEIDISALTSGVYFISLPINGVVTNSKLIKN
jgi:hypothetical protein